MLLPQLGSIAIETYHLTEAYQKNKRDILYYQVIYHSKVRCELRDGLRAVKTLAHGADEAIHYSCCM